MDKMGDRPLNLIRKVSENKLGDRPLPLVICTTLLIEKSPQALPLGAACITSAINHDVLTKNCCRAILSSFSMEDSCILEFGESDEKKVLYIATKLMERNPKIVTFSLFVWNRIILEKVAEILRAKNIICIAGGPEVTANPYSIKNFDYVVCGEGEGSVPKLINKIITSNFAHNNSCEIIPSTIPENLDLSPYLDGLLDINDYEGVLWELARGCPFHCSYCYESEGIKKVRQIPMERIKKELDYFAVKNVSQVFVLDPTYNINKARAIELLKLISAKTPNTFYYFEARAEFIDRELARAFTKIPCALQIGLQSANENVLKLVNRPFDRKKFVKNIKILNEEGVIFGFDLIYGLPGESFQSFVNGIDFALCLYPNNLEIFCLSVLPGTDLYDKASELHLEFEKTPPYHVINTDRFSKKDLLNAKKIADSCNYFYNNGRAVSWFMLTVNLLKIKPIQFLKEFIEYSETKRIDISNYSNVSHKEIEKNQLSFIKYMLTKYQKNKYEKVISSLIILFGALARTQETGVSEKITIFYRPEYLTSQYIMDLKFFIANIKSETCTINTIMRNNHSDWI